jgi:FlaG/FlaF family flagellin (archaellin)
VPRPNTPEAENMKRPVVLVAIMVALAIAALAAGCSTQTKGSTPANANYDKQQSNEAILAELNGYSSGVDSLPALVTSHAASGADIKQMGQNIDTTFKQIEQTASDQGLDIKGLAEAHTALSDNIQGVNDSAPARDALANLSPKIKAVQAEVAKLKKSLSTASK